MPVIAHNIASQFTYRQLNITTNKKTKSAEKLSSGYKINRSADDAAGLQISEKMRSQIRGLNQASRNIQDGISLCQVADGALNETTDILQRMRELSVQSANGTNSEMDREAIQSEIDELTKEVDRIAGTTSFNQDIYPLCEGKNIYIERESIGNNTSADQKYNIEIPAPTLTPKTASIDDSNYPMGSVKNIDASNLNTFSSYRDSDGRVHYVLNQGKYSIDSAIENVVFDVSGNTAIENSSLKNVSFLCADGTTFSINNVVIDNYENDTLIKGVGSAIEFQGSGNTLNCYGNNNIYAGYNDYKAYTDSYNGNPYYIACAGINVGGGDELIINGTDTSVLKVHGASDYNYSTSYGYWAGVCDSWAIGSNFHEDGGSITINGGHIIAYSTQEEREGMGGGCIGGGKNISITINGGEIDSYGGADGSIGGGFTAGMGAGSSASNGVITINDGTINATAENGYAAIGLCNGGEINISGGIVYATGKASQSVGIGGEYSEVIPSINISGGYIYAVAEGMSGAAIGSSQIVSYMGGNVNGTIDITGGTVIAQSSELVQAIGKGDCYDPSYPPISVKINNSSIDTTGLKDGNGHHVYVYPDMINGKYGSIGGNNNTSNSNQEILKKISYKQLWIQAGANTGEGLFLSLVDATAKGIGITDPNVSVMSEEDCDDAMSRLDDAIQTVSSYRSQFGAYQNRLEHAKAVDDNTSENTQYAESRIRDTDMAEEMVEHSKNNILEQVGQSMLAQANQSAQGILSLLS